MTIKKSGKCVVCRKVVIQRRTFEVNVDMFDANSNYLRGEVLERVKAFRDEDVHCENHMSSAVTISS